MLWLKALHISGLVIWCAGLICLPALLLAHGRQMDRQDFARLRMSTRFAYMGVTSLAGFIAIGAGAALILTGDALHPWMYMKLAAVGIMVMIHMQYGHLVALLVDRDKRVPALRIKCFAALAIIAMLVILWLVLAKPDLDPGDLLPDWLREPAPQALHRR